MIVMINRAKETVWSSIWLIFLLYEGKGIIFDLVRTSEIRSHYLFFTNTKFLDSHV